MTTEEIVNAVRYYIQDENAKYAILIDGEWGSGKTYLYENHLVNEIDSNEMGKNDPKYNVYISLYGISTLDSLAKQLVMNYMTCVKMKVDEKNKSNLKKIAGIIGAINNAFSFSIGPVSANFADMINGVENSIEVKNMVICFDDLERCTIPINEFFGFVNNLIEHCNCKVLILADEKNIGKIYANTNLENKYLTVLTGNRKVVENINDEKKLRERQSQAGNNPDAEITVSELKKLNEILYSENYLYKDIKEKVIGRTMYYYPVLDDVISELINGDENNKGIVEEGKFKEYLNDKIGKIVCAFREIENRNLRIAKMWISYFKKIYDVTMKYFADNKYVEDILDEFLRYSIWVMGALKKNKKILQASHANENYVCVEGHRYTTMMRYSFIDSWIYREVWDDADLSQTCKAIIKRKEREDKENPPKIRSEGVERVKLNEWYLMEDDEVKDALARLEKETVEGKYAYYDYSNILIDLLFFQEKGLYSGNIDHIRDIMINLIKEDRNIQDEDEFPKTFSSKKLMTAYNELYMPVAEARKKRNYEISKEVQEQEDIYRNAETFYEHCKQREEYYCNHKAFLQYLDIDKLTELIKNSDIRGLYTICDAFKKVYFMENLKEFYLADAESLKKIRKSIQDEKLVKKGITRKMALDNMEEMISKDLVLLGIDE